MYVPKKSPKGLNKDREAIISMYKIVALEIQKDLLKFGQGDRTQLKKIQILRQIKKKLSEISDKTRKWAELNIKKSYGIGYENINQTIKKEKGFLILQPRALNDTEISIIIDNFLESVEISEARTLSFAKNKVNEMVLTDIKQSVAVGLIAGDNISKLKSDLIEEFSKKNINSVNTGKRRWTLSDYMDMSTRSSLMSAYNGGQEKRLLDAGRRFAKVNTIRPDIDGNDVCNRNEGKIVDLLDVNAVKPLFHPRCRHSLIPVSIEELKGTKHYEKAVEFYDSILEKDIKK